MAKVPHQHIIHLCRGLVANQFFDCAVLAKESHLEVGG